MAHTADQATLLWDELELDGDPVELEAIAAAYALVACVDHVLDPQEKSRFLEIVPNLGRGGEVRRRFDTLCYELKDNFEATRKTAFSLVSSVEKPRARARVLRAAQMAVVADGDVGEAEEQILKEIAAALGQSEALS